MRRSSSVVVLAAFSNVMRHLLDTHCVTRVDVIEFIMYRSQSIYLGMKLRKGIGLQNIRIYPFRHFEQGKTYIIDLVTLLSSLQ